MNKTKTRLNEQQKPHKREASLGEYFITNLDAV
jgi:hypothetical protein